MVRALLDDFYVNNPAPTEIYTLSFFFNDTATTEIYTLSLHDALPIYPEYEDTTLLKEYRRDVGRYLSGQQSYYPRLPQDRKSTRLNSSHGYISYAVFCLKKNNHL